MLEKIINELSKPETICNIGFGCGFLWSLLDSDNHKNPLIGFLKFPLSSIFGAYFDGIVIMFSTNFITNILPYKFKFIVPTSICMSVLYCGYNKFIVMSNTVK